jgi:hypothetical protein
MQRSDCSKAVLSPPPGCGKTWTASPTKTVPALLIISTEAAHHLSQDSPGLGANIHAKQRDQ